VLFSCFSSLQLKYLSWILSNYLSSNPFITNNMLLFAFNLFKNKNILHKIKTFNTFTKLQRLVLSSQILPIRRFQKNSPILTLNTCPPLAMPSQVYFNTKPHKIRSNLIVSQIYLYSLTHFAAWLLHWGRITKPNIQHF